MVKTIHDLKFDPDNANRGTERGRALLSNSLAKLGAGRSIVCSSDGVVLAGNKTLEQAKALGLKIQPVETEGDRLVVVVRKDLKSTDPKAISLKLADNRISELDLDWDSAQVLADLENCELELWTDEEMQHLASLEEEDLDDPFDSFADQPHDGTAEKERSDAACTIGQYRFTIAREQYDRWQEQIRQTIGFDEDSIIAEILRRLGV